MTEEKINLSMSHLMIAVLVVAAGAVLLLRNLFFVNPVNFAILISALLIVWSAVYAYSKSHHFNEMCCMMNGMAFSMLSSFYLGALFAIPNGDFIISMIIGTLTGFALGIPLGRAGGTLGRVEGVMAAPMGGAMGAMTGVMIRAYDVQLFMQFFLIILVFMVYEVTRMNYHNAEKHMSKSMLYMGALLAIVAVASVFMLQFSSGVSTGSVNQITNTNPAAAQPAVNGVQEINMRVGPISYDPNYFVVKKGTPVKINLKVDQNAGCTRAIVFPEFGIRKTLPRGGSDTIQFTPTKAGTYSFRCSMGMATGTFLVQ